MRGYGSKFFIQAVRFFIVIPGVGIVLAMWVGFSVAQSVDGQNDEFDACLMRVLKSAEDDLTVGQIKEACKAGSSQVTEKQGEYANAEETALERRVRQEDSSVSNLWTITPHKQNYILLGAYNLSSPFEGPWKEAAGKDVDLNNTEVKFQVSFKFMLWEDIFKKRKNGDLYFAYTQLAMWQLYNRDISSPFRETNYEPEAFLAFDTAWNIFGFKNRFFLFGVAHQSNGAGTGFMQISLCIEAILF
jgi:phospholipase A1